MRDVVLLLFVLGCMWVTLRYPFAGILTWAWFTIMTPHQMAFGTFGLPLNLIIAAVTIFSMIYSREFERFKLEPLTILLLMFLFWQTVADQMSLVPENSGPLYSRFSKTLFFALLCAQMANTKLRFHALVWVIAGGIGFFAVKGALFTIATLGEYRVQGLAETVLEDNNHFGIAAATALPMIIYLRGQLANPLVKQFMLAAIFLTFLAIIGTHSRGALLAMIVFAGFFWLRSSNKIFMMLVGGVALVPAIAFMPKKWLERMQTIKSATEDESFRGRLDAWEINLELAKLNPFTGVGLRNSYLPEIASLTGPDKADAARAAHSVYFEILGGSGFVGLFLFLTIVGAAFFTARRIEKSKSPDIPEWKRSFGKYAQISLLVFCVGGASTSMEMWDGYLIIIALIAAMNSQVKSFSIVRVKPKRNLVGTFRPRPNLGGQGIELSDLIEQERRRTAQEKAVANRNEKTLRPALKTPSYTIKRNRSDPAT